MKPNFLLLFIAFIIADGIQAAEWQWSVKIKDFVSPETNANPEAFLWIPSGCEQVKGVVFGQHNMCEETIFEHPEFRRAMTNLNFAIIWLTPGMEQQWDVSNGCGKYFDDMIDDLAEVSGYSELSHAPIVPLGHSAMATFPWNFAAWNPERTLAVVSYKGDAPRTNLTGYGRENLEWGRTRNIDGIPGLMIEGEYEWWEARVNPALAFRMMYPESCISFLCDIGHGHFDVSDYVVDYISLFIRKAAQYRLPAIQAPDKPVELTKMDVQKGWLAGRWHSNQSGRAKPAPFKQYKGNRHDAFWYFDEEMAEKTENYYKYGNNKKPQYIGFIDNGKLYAYNEKGHLKYDISFVPGKDGLTFRLSATFTDSLHREATKDHSGKGKIRIDRVCGPVSKVNDSTFTVRFYRMGLNNVKRTNNITLLACHDGDEKYKSAVQELSMSIPYPLTEGVRQAISFPSIQDIERGTSTVKLNAVSDRGLPVCYYIKQGPAEIEDDGIRITDIPPGAKYPLKITVVAWQYGIIDKIQTAEPVERTFYIN